MDCVSGESRARICDEFARVVFKGLSLVFETRDDGPNTEVV